MNDFRRTLIITLSMFLSIGGLVGLAIFIVTFDKSQAAYIGLAISGVSVVAGLTIIRSITKSWSDAFEAAVSVFFFGR